MKSHIETITSNRLTREGYKFESEYRFHETRKWRFDFAFPKEKIAIECEGGVWNQGRHTRGSGFIADTEKYNMAVKLGWRVLRYTTKTIDNLIPDLKELINNNEKETNKIGNQ